jgi:hypothetical protein
VIDGGTGDPIPRARVRVISGPTPSAAVLTDGEGLFTVTGLPAGPANLMVEKATYMMGRIPDTNTATVRSRQQPIVLRDGQVLDNVTVRLFHGGAITGRILDAHGDPVENARITAARVIGATPRSSGVTQSNDLGEYRLPRLSPGRYIVQVRPQNNQMSFPEPMADVPLPQPIPTYYPGSLSVAQAQPITVRRGETLSGVDIMLVEGTPTLVTGTVVRSDGGAIANGNVTSRSVGSDALGGFDFGGGTGLRQGGSFQLTLPPGEYVLEANAQATIGPTRPSPEDQLSGSLRISVAGGAVEAVTIVVGRGATVSGRIAFEGTAPPPTTSASGGPSLFTYDGPGCRQGQMTSGADGTFKVEGLMGTCTLTPSIFGRWMVKSATIRGQSIVDQTLNFEAGQNYTDLQIVATDKLTELDLVVAGDDGQPTKEYVAIAFSVDKTKWNTQSRRLRIYSPPTQSMAQALAAQVPPGATAQSAAALAQQAGRFRGLPPGEYYVAAVDDIGTEEWQDPDVLARLAPNAARVTVTDDAPIEVPLRRVTLADVMR